MKTAVAFLAVAAVTVVVLDRLCRRSKPAAAVRDHAARAAAQPRVTVTIDGRQVEPYPAMAVTANLHGAGGRWS